MIVKTPKCENNQKCYLDSVVLKASILKSNEANKRKVKDRNTSIRGEDNNVKICGCNYHLCEKEGILRKIIE